MRLLERLGYTRVRHYGDGVSGWRRANLPFDHEDDRSVKPEQRAAEVPVAPGP